MESELFFRIFCFGLLVCLVAAAVELGYYRNRQWAAKWLFGAVFLLGSHEVAGVLQ